MTRSTLEAAVRETTRVQDRPQPKGRHGGIPSFFRGCCYTASQGGTSSYRWAAYELTRHIGFSEMPHDVGPDEWAAELEQLTSLVMPGHLRIGESDVDAVWQWFRDHFPKCMALVPARRKQSFVEGVRAAFDDQIIDW